MADFPGFNRGITFADFHMAGMRPVSMDAAIRRERNILAWRPKCFKWSDAIPSFAIALEFDIFLMAASSSSYEIVNVASLNFILAASRFTLLVSLLILVSQLFAKCLFSLLAIL